MNDIQSAIVALFVQSIMYGLYVASTGHVLRWLLFDGEGWRLRPVRDRPMFLMLSMSILLFLLSTADLVTSVILTIEPESTKGYYDINTVNIVVENGTALIADGVLIYRCWIVYAKSWRVALPPTVLWIINLAFSIMITVYEAKITVKPQGTIFLHLWVLFYTFTLVINIYSTSAVIYRIVRVAEESSRKLSGRLYSTCRNLGESGLLYTLTSILILVTSVVYVDPDAPAYSVADSLHFSMTGITFNLILIRSHERDSSEDDSSDAKHETGNQEQLSTIQSHMNTVTNDTNQEASMSVGSEQRNQREIQEVERSW